MMKNVLVTLIALLMASGCSKQVIEQMDKESALALNPGAEYFVPGVFVSDKAKELSQTTALNLSESVVLPQPIDLTKGLPGPFCGLMGYHAINHVPEVQWQLTNWQEYQTYNPIQHIHHNTAPIKRRVIFTLSWAE